MIKANKKIIILLFCITMESNAQQNQMINVNASTTNVDGVPQVQVTWQALNEYLTCYFTAERSSDAKNNFMPFNTISGFGTYYGTHNYLSIDYGPFTNCATYCYRVRLDTTYCVGCPCYFNKYTDTICVSPPVGELYLPNAFSPNADDENDFLKIYYCKMEDIRTFELYIYNRFGEKVFETTNPYFQWDGSYNGTIMNTQVFVYYLKATLNFQQIDRTEFSKKGTISLLK